MTTSPRAGLIIADERAPRLCRPFLLRWFPYFFALLLLGVLPCTVHGQDAAPPGASPTPVLSAPAAATQPMAPDPAAAPEEDIRDIRGPIPIPSPWRWFWVIAGVTVVLALLVTAWGLYRRFASAKAKQPYQIALDRLEQARSLMNPQQAREYSFAVSEITRDYIERRFGEHAARRTTDEFLRDLAYESNSPLAAHQPLLEDFLRYCDLAKFARWELEVMQMESMHESARTFILSTRPEPESAKRGHSKNGTAPHTESTIMGVTPAGRHS